MWRLLRLRADLIEAGDYHFFIDIMLFIGFLSALGWILPERKKKQPDWDRILNDPEALNAYADELAEREIREMREKEAEKQHKRVD